MNSFLSGLKSAATSAVTGGGDDKKTNTDTDLLSSAKLVAEAAQCAASGQTDKIDKPKAAGAAADILESAKEYGKFDETQGVGSYLKKAEDYLHDYEKSGTPAVAPPPVEAEPATAPVEEKKEEVAAPPVEEKKEEEIAPPPVVEEKKEEEVTAPPVEEKKEEVTAPPVEEKKEEAFGAADAFKVAGSFFK